MPRLGFRTLLGSRRSHVGDRSRDQSYANKCLIRASSQTYETNETNESCATNVTNAIDVARKLSLKLVSA
jgi:hypothetical protein